MVCGGVILTPSRGLIARRWRGLKGSEADACRLLCVAAQRATGCKFRLQTGRVVPATPVRTTIVRHVASGEARHILQPGATRVACFDTRRVLLRLVLFASLFSRSRQTQLVSIELSQQARRPTCSLLRVFRLAVRHMRGCGVVAQVVAGVAGRGGARSPSRARRRG